MNQELQKALAEWLRAALAATQTIAGQIPPMLWEQVAYGRVWWTVMTATILGLGLLGAVLLWRWSGRLESRTAEGTSTRAIGRAWAVVIAIMTGFLTLWPASWAVQAWVAPRVFLLNWIRALL